MPLCPRERQAEGWAAQAAGGLWDAAGAGLPPLRLYRSLEQIGKEHPQPAQAASGAHPGRAAQGLGVPRCTHELFLHLTPAAKGQDSAAPGCAVGPGRAPEGHHGKCPGSAGTTKPFSFFLFTHHFTSKGIKRSSFGACRQLNGTCQANKCSAAAAEKDLEQRGCSKGCAQAPRRHLQEEGHPGCCLWGSVSAGDPQAGSEGAVGIG